MYDVIIIGGGPAGMAAAIYLARQKMNFLMLTGDLGGKTLWSADVENYLGFHMVNGVELVGSFKRHLEDYKDQFKLEEGELVERIVKVEGGFNVVTPKSEYQTKTVLIATGEENRKLNIPGEKEFYGKGVTYCATCDGPLFAGKTVHVIGGGNSAMDAALLLEKYATHVTIVSANPELRGDEVMKNKCLSSPKIEVFGGTKTTKIFGDQFVTGVGLIGPDGVERIEETQGIIVEIGLIPVSGFIDFVEKDNWSQIVVDKHCRTSEQGIWAAGDVTDVSEKQIAVAVGEGSKAALDMIKYLTSKN
ncbi:MAG: FAD-dependent oxidoreductase [Patescibacteria group bacterium]|nr:FAD-dependent oxidoreductase [Patescibacteria group bacterium]